LIENKEKKEKIMEVNLVGKQDIKRRTVASKRKPT
jgi:hypothetical protein